jgi:hypothetical protein
VRPEEERKQFFFEKKNQKTFVYKAFALRQRIHQMGKSFRFFFQKEVLSCCRWVSLKATWYYLPTMPLGLVRRDNSIRFLSIGSVDTRAWPGPGVRPQKFT